MNKLIVPGALAALGLYFLSKKPTTTHPDYVFVPDYTGGTVQDNGGYTIGGATPPTITDTIDYQRWLRKDWAIYFKNLIAQNGLQQASTILFQKWYNPENKARNMFPTRDRLVLDLALCKLNTSSIGTGFNVEWNSIPVYTGVYSYWAGYAFWDCEDWKTFHVKLEQHYHSTAKANQVWLAAWLDDQNWTQASSTTYWLLPSGVLPPSANCPTDGNCWFVEYFYSKGIDVGTMLGNASCSLQNVVQNIVVAVENVSTGIADTTKVLSVALPLGIALGAYYFIKRQKNAK
jgi:hypothetical protein